MNIHVHLELGLTATLAVVTHVHWNQDIGITCRSKLHRDRQFCSRPHTEVECVIGGCCTAPDELGKACLYY